jgi:outer membrane protein assembly factor BamD (BamD/ComL family)
MSISGILASTFTHQQSAPPATPYQQQIQQLGQALQSGNLSAAQSDFANLQQAFSQPAPTTGPASTNTSTPVNQSFSQLASDLRSGNLAAAQKDFSTIQQGIKPQGSPLTNHFRYHVHSHNGGEDARS